MSHYDQQVNIINRFSSRDKIPRYKSNETYFWTIPHNLNSQNNKFLIKGNK